MTRMHDLDQTSPAACARIRAALGAPGHSRAVAPELGSLVRAIAASKPGGTFLCLGVGAGEMAAWVLDGMDLSSGLVALVHDREEQTAVEFALGGDLRVSVHEQDAKEFLIDVKAHHFDLIVDRMAGGCREVLRRGLAMLRPGGFYLAADVGSALHDVFAACATPPDAQAPEFPTVEFYTAPIGVCSNAMLVVRRTERLRPKRRRHR